MNVAVHISLLWYDKAILNLGGFLMARIRIILEDDHGQPLTPEAEHLYPLEGPCNTLDAIENAVETWRKYALPAIEKTLLVRAQQDDILKKSDDEVQRHLSPQGAHPPWHL